MTKQISPIEFNPYRSSLEPGINLIEASAGTGKTFSIAMLVMRFILQQGYSIDQLLVVTFTNAAAQELRERIRSRLLEIKAVFAGKPSTDDHLNDWVAELPEQQARTRLVNALADIDSAHIFTIHGFCQRMLSQYALESGQVFGSELLQNTSQVTQQIAEDYWRLQTYERSIQQVILLRNSATSPYALLDSIDGIREGSVVVPEADDLELSLLTAESLVNGLRPTVTSLVFALETAIDQHADKFKPAFVNSFQKIRESLNLWLGDKTEEPIDSPIEHLIKHKAEVILPLDDILALSTLNISNSALNGTKFRKTKALTGEQRKLDFLQEFSINSQLIDELEQSLSSVKIAFQRGLYEYSQHEIESRLTKSNQLSFDGIIKRLSEALKNTASDSELTSNAAHLKQLLQDKFPVALIDEFQDTDDAQWSIFSALASPSNYLYLIGDPKQAIYKFRGADIYSYLAAQQQAQRHYNLTKNWRSQQPLVQAVNALFEVDNPFLIEQIAYHPVNAALQNTVLAQTDDSLEKLVLWELDKNPDQKDGYWLTTKGKPKEQIRAHVVKEILSLLSTATLKNGDGINTKVSPSDIAILVRSNPEAAAYQHALMQYGVPSVLNSKTSVFASTQAVEIYHILHAISRPGSQQLMRYALCQSWFGLDGNDIYDLQDQPHHVDNWLISFQHYHELWERKGLLAMMHKLMEEQGVVQHLSGYLEVERNLTNINHILEMLQEAALSKRLSMHKTLEWLEDAIEQRIMMDGQELRLESDENAVNIVTIHSSKGLEYPIVFCPDLWAKNSMANRSKVVVLHKDGKQVSDLGSEQLEHHRELKQQEDKAEELRLLYVAITRAKFRCYVGWVDQRTAREENNSALAYLLKHIEGESWTERMAGLANKQNKAFEYQLLEVDTEISGFYENLQPKKILTNRQLQRKIKANWKMSSYSAMAYYSVHDSDVPELPLDKAQEQDKPEAVSGTNENNENLNGEVAAIAVPTLLLLPKGAHTGNLVHELLELTPFSVLSSQLDNVNYNADYIKNRTEMIKRFAVDIATEDTVVLDNLLSDTVNTVLSDEDSHFILANLNESQCLKEMPFYFAVESLNTLEVNGILADSMSYLPLSAQQMQGQLTGFIDLICEYQGQYYVMDYKTNSLADYSVISMTESMREHNYGLQYWIYSLVLHRYLQQTLEGYTFDKHFGGVRYLFVRGMNPDEPMSGVFQDQPDLETIERLSKAFQ